MSITVATDTFTDAQGRRYIAGEQVSEQVWERFNVGVKSIKELEAALRSWALSALASALAFGAGLLLARCLFQ